MKSLDPSITCRDVLVLSREEIVQLDNSDNSMQHFNNLQSTNWQNLKLKPPSMEATDKLGWRVEFRPCELQFTDFENAAFSVFVVLVVKMALAKNLCLLMPISKVDDNFERAQRRDAVLRERFHFRYVYNCGWMKKKFERGFWRKLSFFHHFCQSADHVYN